MFENTGDTFWKTKRGKQINTLVVNKKPLASDKFLSIESIHARTILRPHINNTREKIGGRTGGLKFFVVTTERKKQTNRNERFSKSAEKRDESKPMKRTDNVSFLLLFVCLMLSRCVEALTRLEKENRWPPPVSSASQREWRGATLSDRLVRAKHFPSVCKWALELRDFDPVNEREGPNVTVDAHLQLLWYSPRNRARAQTPPSLCDDYGAATAATPPTQIKLFSFSRL